MGLRDPLRDRQPEAETASLRRARTYPVGPPESLEYVGKIGRGDPDSRVLHGELRLRPLPHQIELYLPPARRVLDRVGHQIEEQLPKPSPVAHHRQFVDRRHRDLQFAFLTEDERGLHDFADERLQRDHLAMQVESPLVGAGEREERIDEVSHARRLLQCLFQRDELVRGMRGELHRPLHVGAHDGQRRLELVRGVGGEAAQRAERRFQTPDHRIERRRQARHLVARRLDREPAVQRSPVGDVLHLGRDPVDRAYGATGDEVAAAGRDDQDEGEDHQGTSEDLTRRVVELPHVHPRDYPSAPEDRVAVSPLDENHVAVAERDADGALRLLDLGERILEGVDVALGHFALREAWRKEIQVDDRARGIQPAPRLVVEDDEVAGDLHQESRDFLVEDRADKRIGDDDLFRTRPLRRPQDGDGEVAVRTRKLRRLALHSGAPGKEDRAREDRHQREHQGGIANRETDADRGHVRPSRRSRPLARW